jgi:hypothetical protein
MSSSQSAQLAAELRTRMEKYGVQEEALEWLIKALHPAYPSSAPAMPDQTYVESVRPEYRDQSIVSSPTGLSTATWDLCIVRTPGDLNPVIWMAGNAETNFASGSSSSLLNVGQVNLVGTNFGPDGALPPLYGSGSTALPYANLVPADLRLAWRTSYASLSCYMTASALNDQGTVFAGQLAREYLRAPTTAWNSLITSPSGASLPVSLCYASVPTNEDQLLLICPKAYTAPARDGCYIPIRLSGPTQPFVTPVRGVPGIVAGTVAGGGSGNFSSGVSDNPSIGSVSSAATLPILEGHGTGLLAVSQGGADALYNYGHDNTYTSVVFFRGLSPSASITLKYFTGQELEVDPSSPIRQFAKVPSPYSPNAMEAYYRLVHELPGVYPSSFNSLGTILTAIGSVASRMWPVVQRVVPSVMHGVSAAAARYGDLSALQTVKTPPPRAVLSMKQGVPTKAKSKRARRKLGKSGR